MLQFSYYFSLKIFLLILLVFNKKQLKVNFQLFFKILFTIELFYNYFFSYLSTFTLNRNKIHTTQSII